MDELIPIMGMILVLGPVATWIVSMTPLGRALAERWRAEARGSDERLLETQEEVDQLREHIVGQDQRLDELHDRLDFTERLLTRKASADPDERHVATPV